MVGLMVTSKRVFTKGDFPRRLLPVPPSLWWAPADPNLHRGPATLTDSFGSVSYGVSQCSFPLSLGELKVLFVPSKTRVSCFPQSCGSHWPSQSDSQSLVRSSGWQVAFRTLTTVRELWYYCSQFMGHPASGYRIWFYCDCSPPSISLQLLHCPLTWGTFFWWVPVSSCWWLFNS